MTAKPCWRCGCTSTRLRYIRTSEYRIVDGARQEMYTLRVVCNRCRERGPAVAVFVSMWKENIESYLEKHKEKAVQKWNRRADNG